VRGGNVFPQVCVAANWIDSAIVSSAL